MKTTLILRDEVVRQAKSRAALAGIPLSKYVEQCLAAEFKSSREEPSLVHAWLAELPQVSAAAVQDLNEILRDAEFRAVESGMWQ